MAELSPRDQVMLSRISGDMMTSVLLDDAWTESVRRRPMPSGHPTSPIEITGEMGRLLQRMGEAADFIGALPERMGADLSARSLGRCDRSVGTFSPCDVHGSALLAV